MVINTCAITVARKNIRTPSYREIQREKKDFFIKDDILNDNQYMCNYRKFINIKEIKK